MVLIKEQRAAAWMLAASLARPSQRRAIGEEAFAFSGPGLDALSWRSETRSWRVHVRGYAPPVATGEGLSQVKSTLSFGGGKIRFHRSRVYDRYFGSA